MHKTPISSAVAVNPSLVSFKPRQVLLATTSKMKQNEKKNNHKDDAKSAVRTLKSEEKALLLKCVAGYLKSNGFSKTLKKFLSEAEIEVGLYNQFGKPVPLCFKIAPFPFSFAYCLLPTASV